MDEAVRIPPESEIAEAKLKDYLLTPRLKGDKSNYLGRAGFTRLNYAVLEGAIRRHATDHAAVRDRVNRFGTFYRVEGTLVGPHAILHVATIWLQPKEGGQIRFVTLKPLR